MNETNHTFIAKYPNFLKSNLKKFLFENNSNLDKKQKLNQNRMDSEKIYSNEEEISPD